MAEIRHKQVIPGRGAGEEDEFPLETTQQKRPLRRSSGDAQGMGALSSFKGDGLVQLLFLPNGEEDARPSIGQGPNRYGMTLAFGTFALVVFSSPGFSSVESQLEWPSPKLNELACCSLLR